MHHNVQQVLQDQTHRRIRGNDETATTAQRGPRSYRTRMGDKSLHGTLRLTRSSEACHRQRRHQQILPHVLSIPYPRRE